MLYRKRGASIIVTKKGILIVAKKNKKFSLPGGGVKRGESGKEAAVRELHEETGLKAIKVSYLFDHIGEKWHYNTKGKHIRNHTKVFLVKAEGVPKPRHEIKYINFWKSGSKLRISKGAERVIKKYFKINPKPNFQALSVFSCFL